MDFAASRKANELYASFVSQVAMPGVKSNIPEYPLTAVREDGDKVRIVTHPSNIAEAQWVASEIERLHRAGAKWRTVAVLYRSHAHRDKLVEVLKGRKVPFVIKNLSILSV